MTDHDPPAAGRQPEPTRRRPTVYEVAARAGVSIATVSRALRKDSPVAPQTRQRVMAAAHALNWRPSRAAQALAGDQYDAVAIVLPDLAGPYYAQVIAGFESEVVERGSAVMVLATHGRRAADQMVRDLAGRIDGLVIMDQTIPDATVAELTAAGVPVILLARPALPGAAAVRSRNLPAALALTEHLLSRGRRRLRFLGDPDRSPDVRERWDGFVQAHRSAGLVPADPVRCQGFEAETGHQAAMTMFQQAGTDVDGVVCGNDELASGVYRAAAETGRRIPDDLAVTGWDDVTLAAHLTPPLTTVTQPMRQLGGTAARLLFDQLEGRAVESVTLDTEPVHRESCGCPSGTGTV